jgi:hypothetical protein
MTDRQTGWTDRQDGRTDRMDGQTGWTDRQDGRTDRMDGQTDLDIEAPSQNLNTPRETPSPNLFQSKLSLC